LMRLEEGIVGVATPSSLRERDADAMRRKTCQLTVTIASLIISAVQG
jgi:hypothetical protein